jgi:hypothetical protein
MDEVCRHELIIGHCAVCNPRSPQAEFSQPAEYGPWFAARFDSECDDCGGDITEGDRIRADGEGGYVCESCGEDKMTAFAQPAAGWVRPPLEGVAGELASSVIGLVKNTAANAPRSLQAAPGPSELGTPCTRRLGYKTLDWEPKPNKDTDPWASVIGISVHAWMAAAYAAENLRGGHEPWDPACRYLIEHRVHLPGGISGSSDLYDRDTGVNNDWKVTGLDRLKEYRRNGPGPQYRAQAHLYALGMQLAGENPQHVAITFLPRGGRVDMLHVWAEPYQPAIAVQALKRYQAVRSFHITVDPEAHPERWGLLPTADAHCTYCPWLLPGSADLSQGCPGHNPAPNPPHEKNGEK